ncbi:MAG: hypothetical protein ACKO96_41015, partial [Flammeovirgaceae bacterium]
EIGGQLNLVNGNFDVRDATLLIHTNSAPLVRTGGQVSTNSNTTLLIGNGEMGGATITLASGIFVSPSIVISSLTINRTNGAILNDQSIQITTAATFTKGNLTLNGSGRILFDEFAADPIETEDSHIIGYAEMMLRTVGTGALDFLGFSMSIGADAGDLSVVRRTGTPITFNGNQS